MGGREHRACRSSQTSLLSCVTVIDAVRYIVRRTERRYRGGRLPTGRCQAHTLGTWEFWRPPAHEALPRVRATLQPNRAGVQDSRARTVADSATPECACCRAGLLGSGDVPMWRVPCRRCCGMWFTGSHSTLQTSRCALVPASLLQIRSGSLLIVIRQFQESCDGVRQQLVT